MKWEFYFLAPRTNKSISLQEHKMKIRIIKKRRRNKVGNSYNVSFWIEGMEKLLPTI